MSTRTDAIKAAISATAPAELQWLPNPGHDPAIPEGWEFAGVEYVNGDRIMLDEAAEPSAWAWDFINHRSDLRRYAIRRKPSANLGKEAGAQQPDGCRLQPIRKPNAQPTLAEVVSSANCDGLRLYRAGGSATDPKLIRHQSGALVIAGRLTSVGERFAGIDSGDQQITLSINTEQARWLGRYVGGEVKLTVEVTP